MNTLKTFFNLYKVHIHMLRLKQNPKLDLLQKIYKNKETKLSTIRTLAYGKIIGTGRVSKYVRKM